MSNKTDRTKIQKSNMQNLKQGWQSGENRKFFEREFPNLSLQSDMKIMRLVD